MPALTKNGGPATGLLVEKVSDDERTIVLRVDGNPCSSTRLDSIEEDSSTVRVALETSSVSGNQMCPLSIVFQGVTLQLGAPLGDRRIDVVTALAE